jgi:hypothetical protein
MQIARGLVRRLGDFGGGCLILALEPKAPLVSDAAKHELFGLTGALCEQLCGQDVTVSVRLGERAQSHPPLARALDPAALAMPGAPR